MALKRRTENSSPIKNSTSNVDREPDMLIEFKTENSTTSFWNPNEDKNFEYFTKTNENLV